MMYSYGPLHMAEQKQGDQLEPIYSSPENLLEAMNDKEGWQDNKSNSCFL